MKNRRQRELMNELCLPPQQTDGSDPGWVGAVFIDEWNFLRVSSVTDSRPMGGTLLACSFAGRMYS